MYTPKYSVFYTLRTDKIHGVNDGATGPHTANGSTNDDDYNQPEINSYYPTEGGVD